MSDLRATLVGVAVGNLLPLALVLVGVVDLPDLLVLFALETVLLAAASGNGGGTLVAAVYGFVFGFRALTHITWDAASVAGIVGCLAATGASLWWARREGRRVEVGLGSLLWRSGVLLVGAVLLLGWVDDLADAGLPAGPVDDDVLFAAGGRWLNEQAVAVGAEPLAVAAVVLVLFKLWNELAHEAYRHARVAA